MNANRLETLLLAITLLSLVLAPALAIASDGRIEINQARALAGGVTPGDTPGFPVTLDSAGSYVLTGPLIVSDPDTDCIEVTAERTSIDLAGFALRGPVNCSGSGDSLTCSAGTGIGIEGNSSTAFVAVKNGQITNFGGGGTNLGDGARIDRVQADRNGGPGLFANDLVLIHDSSGSYNNQYGIFAFGGSIVKRSTARGNLYGGILALDGSVISENSSAFNGLEGVASGSGAVVRDNEVANNEYGIVTGLVSVIANNNVGGHDESLNTSFGSVVLRNVIWQSAIRHMLIAADTAFGGNVATNTLGGAPSAGSIGGVGVSLGENHCVPAAPGCP